MSELDAFADLNDVDDDNDSNIELDAANDSRVAPTSVDVRRKIEDILERKRLRREFDDLDF